VPFRWPSGWTDPNLVALFEGGPINCLVLDKPQLGPIAAAASKAGLAVRDWSTLGAAPFAEFEWGAQPPIVAITGLVWPRIKISPRGERDAVQAGPTGVPWIDSNCWVARLAMARAPGKQVWLGFEPPPDEQPPRETAYCAAIADAAATGARWMISLHAGHAKGLAAGDSDALRTWKTILHTLTFFEKHREWRDHEPGGTLGVLSSFSGESGIMAQEVLNLAARRNLQYRILDKPVAMKQSLAGLRAVLLVDNDPPPAELATRLAEFARGGGLVIVPRALATTFAGERPVLCPVGGFELRSLGRGSLAIAKRDWEDPFFLAADVHSLAGSRNDPVLMFNAPSLLAHYSVAPRGERALLQLVGFTGRRSASVSVAVAQAARPASMYIPESDAPTVLEAVKVGGRTEYHLPPFSFYAALEFRL
jgi:hypothetical protein